MDWAVLVPELTTFHLYGLLWSTKNNKHKEEKKTDEGSFGTKKPLTWIHSISCLKQFWLPCQAVIEYDKSLFQSNALKE